MQDQEASPVSPATNVARFEQEIHVLRERLAFYEGFDQLIQDNIANARELFRLAAQEREAALAEIERAKSAAGQGQAQHRADLAEIATEVDALSGAVAALSRRIVRALRESEKSEVEADATASTGERQVAVVAHGMPSARSAKSLQRFIASLPHVTTVTAREFSGGVLRLDASVREPLLVEQFRGWEPSRPVALLTERADVVELAFMGESV
jgi:hypothetical protein